MKAPSEGWIDLVPQIAGEDDQALVRVEALQQVADLGVGIPVGAVPDFPPLAEESIRFVEEQHGAASVRDREYGIKILGSLAHPLRYHAGKVHRDQTHPEQGCDHFGGESFARPWI